MENILRNAWYMAGWEEEAIGGKLDRRIGGTPLLLMHDGQGAWVALENRCPHRFAPLSLGEVSEGRVTCPYHGLTFDGSGACVRNPFSDRIPAGAKVRSFPVQARHSILWVWLGDHDAANPALIPDFAFLPDGPTNRTVRGYTRMLANYEYGTDNLMDLSHIEFVHRGTFAGQGVIFAGKHTVEQEGDSLHSNWWMPDIAPPSVAQGVYPPDARVDHWLDMCWNAPASMRLEVGVSPAGEGRDAGFTVPQAHILTPESETTSHYFWATCRSNDLDSPETDAFLQTLFGQAFDLEDKPIIEAAYANMDGVEFWDRKPVFLGIDAGGTRARRLLEQLIRAERAV